MSPKYEFGTASAKVASTPSQKPKQRKLSDLPKFYYYGARGDYYVEVGSEWRRQTESGAKRWLKSLGLTGQTREGEYLSEVDLALQECFENNYVDYVSTRISGLGKGAHVFDGKTVLALKDHESVKSAQGDWSDIRGFMETLFGEQVQYVYAWLKLADEGLEFGRKRPGQALIIVGEPGCGKSAFQSGIVTPLLGGVESDPYRYLSGKTAFNASMMGAVHQRIDDPDPPRDQRERQSIGQRLKECIARDTKRIEAKGVDAIDGVPCMWRFSMSLNTGMSLDAAPIGDRSILDKLILLKVNKAKLPGDNEDENSAVFREQLPAFVHYLRYEHTINPADCDERNRYGVRSYHDPELKAEIEGGTPSALLHEMICELINSDHSCYRKKWKVRELHERLSDKFRESYWTSFRSSARLGRCLKTLSEERPEEYARTNPGNVATYEVTPRPEEGPEYLGG